MASRVCELGNLIKLRRIEVFHGYMDIKRYIKPMFCQQTTITSWMTKDMTTLDGYGYVVPFGYEQNPILLAKFINNYVVFEKEIENLVTCKQRGWSNGETKRTFYHYDRDGSDITIPESNN